MGVVWVSDPTVNPIGMEARLIDLDGDKTLEATFVNNMSVKQRLKAVIKILSGKSIDFASIYVEGKHE